MSEFLTEEEQVERLKQWWKENGRSIIAGVVIGLGVFGSWQGWRAYQIQQAEAAPRPMMRSPRGRARVILAQRWKRKAVSRTLSPIRRIRISRHSRRPGSLSTTTVWKKPPNDCSIFMRKGRTSLSGSWRVCGWRGSSWGRESSMTPSDFSRGMFLRPTREKSPC